MPFSQNDDVKLTLRMLTSLIAEKWDWKEISSNRGFELSAEFVTEHDNFSWDWYELTSRRDCQFTIEYIKEYKTEIGTGLLYQEGVISTFC